MSIPPSKLTFFFLKTNFENNWFDPHYGAGFHLVSLPIETIVDRFYSFKNISEEGKILIVKHPSVFIFFLLSALCFKKIIYFHDIIFFYHFIYRQIKSLT